MKNKIYINQVIVVEGKYDKIKLDSIFNAIIIVANGFQIYKDRKKISTIRRLADKYGVIILTDSDVAGFRIRNFISGFLPQEKIIQIYIPQILGKERRKVVASKENMLGVEGLNEKLILQCFRSAGVIESYNICRHDNKKLITNLDLYEDGLIGNTSSEQKRQYIKHKLNLPTYLSTKALIKILNKIITYDEYKIMVNNLYFNAKN